MICPKCGKENKETAKFCFSCGTPFTIKEDATPKGSVQEDLAQRIVCPKCGRIVKPGMKFCTGCGWSVGDGNFVESKPIPKKKKSKLPIVIGLLVFGIVLAGGILVAAIFLLNNKNTDGNEKDNRKNLVELATTEKGERSFDHSKKQDTASSQAVGTNESEEGTTTEESEEATIETPEQMQLPGIDAQNTGDYNKCLDKVRYKTVKLDTGFSFIYPPDFFSEVEQDGNNYMFSASDGEVIYAVNEHAGSGDALQDVAEYYDSVDDVVDDEESNPLTGFRNISDEVKEGWAHAIISGRFLDDQSRGMYFLVVSDGENVYTMEIDYAVMGDKDDYETPQNYMIDCLYRGFAHSGTSYKLRSYKQFKKGDMGEKK